jgi:hypothetical protein
MSKELNVLCVEPGKVPREATLQNDLHAMQDAVGGLIEVISMEKDVCILCNDEAKLIGLEGNRRVGNDVIAGTFYVLGCSEDGDLTSLPDEKMKEYAKRFHEPEVITQQEIEATTGFTFVEL